MKSRNTLSALSTALLAATLSACGGGGGGGAAPQTEPTTPRQQLTPLPAFLQAATTQCTFEEGGQQVSLTDYRGNLDNVTALSCSGVIFTDLNEIDLLTALQRLSLENSVLTGITELAGITTLKELDLSGSPLANLDTIAALTGLTRLDLENTSLSDITLLNALTALQSLDLSGNGITDVSALNSLQNLTTLDLSGNHITNPAPLAALTGLQNLDLSGNDGLSCVDANSLDTNLGGATQIAVPSACTSALFLTAGSAASQTIDNSLQADPFARLVISDVTGLKDVALFVEGDDLRVDANTSNGKKQITFTNWFVDAAYQVAEFEIVGNSILGFNSLRGLVGLGLELTDGKDTYTGNNDSYIIYGLGEDDIIAGGSGRDIIVGGRGNDILSGYQLTIAPDGTVTRTESRDNYQDQFIYQLGDGNDTIYEYESEYSWRGLLRFDSGITSEDITLYRDDGDLIFELDTDNSVTIKDWFISLNYQIGFIKFGQGQTTPAYTWINSKKLYSRSNKVLGTNDSQYLTGSEYDDILMGLGGSDTLEGGKGDDIIAPNEINVASDGTITRVEADQLSTDTIIYNLGDGNDTIYEYHKVDQITWLPILKFGPGITSDDITIYREGDDLILELDINNSVTIPDWYTSRSYRLGHFQFGTDPAIYADQWLSSKPITIKKPGILLGSDNQKDTLLGTEGNDIIVGLSGLDTLEGGKGDDVIATNQLNIAEDGTITRNDVRDSGGDIIKYNLGDGNDTIYEYNTEYYLRGLLQFGSGITSDDISVYRVDGDLILELDADNSITIKDWFISPNYRISYIQFGEEPGTFFTPWLEKKPLSLKQPGILSGSLGEANILLGTDGNDVIIGLDNKDTLESGKGDDVIATNQLNIAEDGTITRNDVRDSIQDVIIYNLGDGNDTIYEYETDYYYRALLKFGPGITPTDLSATQSGSDLVLTLSSGGSITVKDWFTNTAYQLGQIQFDGEAAQNAEPFVNSLLNP